MRKLLKGIQAEGTWAWKNEKFLWLLFQCALVCGGLAIVIIIGVIFGTLFIAEYDTTGNSVCAAVIFGFFAAALMMYWNYKDQYLTWRAEQEKKESMERGDDRG